MFRFNIQTMLIVLLFFIGSCTTTGTNGVNDPYEQSTGVEERTSKTPGWLEKVFDALTETASETLEEHVDKAVGTYDGKIVGAMLIEQNYDDYVFEVHYKNVKYPAKTLMAAEVLKGGSVQSGFTCQQNSLDQESGSLLFLISKTYSTSYGSNYETYQDENSDQILFYLYYPDNPDKRFGLKTISFQNQYPQDYHADSYTSPTSSETQPQVYESDSTSGYQAEWNKTDSGWVTEGPQTKWDPAQPVQQNTGKSSISTPKGTMIKANPLPEIPVAMIGSNLEYDIDRPGKDIKSLNLSTPDPKLCMQECANYPDCRAFTYVKPGVQSTQAKCWLKHSIPGPVKNTNCISGIVRP